VSVYEPPRIKKTLEFVRQAHGPGDVVKATVELERAAGDPLSQAPFTALVVLDNQELHRMELETDGAGRAMVTFQLPDTISRGDGLLTILVDDGGVTESIQRRIPIALDRIKLDVYPEGGDLVQGLPSRVYFDARSLIDKPLDIEAKIVDDTGKTLDTTKSFHDGMGRFELTPEAGRTYELVVTKPTSISQRVTLPEPREAGCTMRVVDDFESKHAEVKAEVACTEKRDVVLVSIVHGKMMDATGRTVGPGGKRLVVAPGERAQGATRLTLFSREGTPLAERLVYRGLRSGLNVEITPDQESYAPRDQVTLDIAVENDAGEPVQADLALSVVDDTVLSYADDKNARILASMLLLPEMPGQVIDEPVFYFSDDEKAPRAMDLLLGTKGWRRFAWEWE